jgi:hypothetical protein
MRHQHWHSHMLEELTAHTADQGFAKLRVVIAARNDQIGGEIGSAREQDVGFPIISRAKPGMMSALQHQGVPAGPKTVISAWCLPPAAHSESQGTPGIPRGRKRKCPVSALERWARSIRVSLPWNGAGRPVPFRYAPI